MVHQTPACWGNPQSPNTSRRCHNFPYEKIGKNEPVCIADEVPFESPESWEWVRFKNLVSYSMGKTPPRKESEYWTEPVYPWVSIADMNADSTILSTKEMVNEYAAEKTFRKRISKAGTLLMSFKLTVGKVSLLGIDAYHNEAIISIYPFVDNDAIITNYLFYIIPLISQSGQTKTAIKGNTLNSESLDALMIPLPPLREQERICKRLNDLKPKLSAYNKTYNEASLLNEGFPTRLKKSILQYAVQGKLVPQAPTDEPASILLERIRAEKEQLIKSGKIKRDKHESVIFRRDNSYYERVDGIERCIDEEIPFEISDSWEWVRLGELIETIDTGKSFKCEERPPDKNEYGIIKVSAVTWGTFNQEESKTCFSTSPWVKGYSIQVDDFLICRANTAALVGGCVIVDKISKRLMLSDKVLRIEFSDSISKTYVLYTLRTPFVRAQLSAAASGTSESMKNISQNAIKGLLIPFPPLKEQYRIVSKVEESLSKIKTL